MTRLVVIVLMFVALALVSVAVLDKVAPSSCADANGQLADGMVTQAANSYALVLADDPHSECATKGLRKVARKRYLAAKQLVSRDLTAQAKKALVAMLDAEPASPHSEWVMSKLANLGRDQEGQPKTQEGETR
jgi:hypothetical protein